MPTTRPTARPTTRSGRQIGKKVSFEDTAAAAESSRSSRSARPAPSQTSSSRRSASKPRSASKSRPQAQSKASKRAPKKNNSSTEPGTDARIPVAFNYQDYRREVNEAIAREREDMRDVLEAEYRFEARDREITKERAEAGYRCKLQLDLVRRQVNAKARQSLVPLWNTYAGTKAKDELEFAGLSDQLQEAREKNNLLGDVTFVAHINAKAKDARQIRFDSLDQFSEKVGPALEDTHRSHPTKEIDLRVQCLAFPSPVDPEAEELGKGSHKRSIDEVDGPAPSPRKEGGRKTYTTEQARFREQQNVEKEDVGKKVAHLNSVLKCHTSTCRNEHEHCWIEEGIHYPINDHLQREQWARDWQAGLTSELVPPPSLRKHLYLAENEFKSGKKTKKQSRQEEREEEERRRREEREEEQRRWREEDDQRRREQREADRRRQERDDRQQERSDRQQEAFSNMIYQQQSWQTQKQQWKMQQQMMREQENVQDDTEFVSDVYHVSANSRPQFAAPNPRPRASHRGPPPATLQQDQEPVKRWQSTSPVAPPEEEDEMIEQFWAIKLEKTPAKHRKRVRQAREKIDNEMWSSTSIQRMSDPSGELFKRAATKGVPEQLLLDLRRELHDYKEVYRTGRDLAAISRS